MEKKMNKKFRLANSVQAYGCVCVGGCACACGIFTNKNKKDASNEHASEIETRARISSAN